MHISRTIQGPADPREPTRHIWDCERTKIDKLCQLCSPANFLYGTSFGGSITSNLLVRSLRVIAMKSVAGTHYNEKKSYSIRIHKIDANGFKNLGPGIRVS